MNRQLDENVCVIESAFKSRIVSYRLTANAKGIIDIYEFISRIQNSLIQLITQQLATHTSLKINCELFALCFLETKDVEEVKSFLTKNIIITAGSDLLQYCTDLSEILYEKLSEFQERDSGTNINYYYYYY